MGIQLDSATLERVFPTSPATLTIQESFRADELLYDVQAQLGHLMRPKAVHYKVDDPSLSERVISNEFSA